MTLAQHRARLRKLAAQRIHVESQRREAAQDARRAGLSIVDIAGALGVSRMYAHRLVHGRTDR
jgi:hypothetical protein